MATLYEELQARARAARAERDSRQRPRIIVGLGSCGIYAGAHKTLAALRAELERRGLEADIQPTGCIGLCYAEPLVDVIKSGAPRVSFANVYPEDVPGLVERYLVGDNPEGAHFQFGEDVWRGIRPYGEVEHFKYEYRIVTERNGRIDPESLADSLASEGYAGLARALAMPPSEVIDEVKQSGLVGCGGAAFPTGMKWSFCLPAPGPEKYMLCNADEGNPGTWKDRLIMEGDPHALVEGMAIAAYAIQAPHGFIYIRDEYPLAIARVRRAIADAEAAGIIGDNCLGSGFSFRLRVKEGAGSYLCGEEMAMIASVEGKRGMPRSKPPFPAASGAFGKPTTVNNVETLANAAAIMRNGWEWYAALGSEKSKGTRTICGSGAVKRGGAVECEFGKLTIKQILFDVFGIEDGQTFKAVQMGGPATQFLPESLIDVPMTFEDLRGVDPSFDPPISIGSGGLVVVPAETCLVDLTWFLTDWLREESCNKCFPCRLGTQRMTEMLYDWLRGKGSAVELDVMASISESMRLGSLCGHGVVAGFPYVSTAKYFRDEYLAHIGPDGHCPAGVCELERKPELIPVRAR